MSYIPSWQGSFLVIFLKYESIRSDKTLFCASKLVCPVYELSQYNTNDYYLGKQKYLSSERVLNSFFLILFFPERESTNIFYLHVQIPYSFWDAVAISYKRLISQWLLCQSIFVPKNRPLGYNLLFWIIFKY